MADTKVDLYALLRDFNNIGGMGQTGQSGFCLLMALWQRSNELKWIRQFAMTNTELLFKAGFNSEKHLWDTRNRLTQLGYFEYIKPSNRRSPGTYIMNFDLLGLLSHSLPQVNSKGISLPQVNSEARSEANSEVNSGTNINKLTKPTEQNHDDCNKKIVRVDDRYEYSKGIFLSSDELTRLTNSFSARFGKNCALQLNHYVCVLSLKKTQDGYISSKSDFEELMQLAREERTA